ncbi:MAG: undecaprenyl diphosphate synthase family protein, partial [Candidatus Aenigmatarchaeota archaeon]
RTAYEHRISDCLPYQAAYSEFIFLKKCFPEITKEDMVAAIWEYKRRKRSFGV